MMDNNNYEPLYPLVQPYLYMNFGDLPENIGERIEREIVGKWNNWTPAQRAYLAKQYDTLHDPAKKEENQHWSKLSADIIDIKSEIVKWEAMSHFGIPSEAALKKLELRKLHAELTELESKWNTPYSGTTVASRLDTPKSPGKGEQQAPAIESMWKLKTPKRYQDYGKPLYDLMKAAHTAGLPPPTARDVLDEFKKKKPPEIVSVMTDSMDFLNGKGERVTAELDSIRKAIARLVIR